MRYVHARLASEELVDMLLLPIGPSEDELAVAGGRRGGRSSSVGGRWRSGGRVRGVVVIVVVVVASSYVNINIGIASLLRCGGRIGRHGALLAALAFLVSIGLTTSKSMVIGRNTR